MLSYQLLKRSFFTLPFFSLLPTFLAAQEGGDSHSTLPAALIEVEPRQTPELPEGETGIASKYPGDEGIDRDPEVVFVESFEGTIDEICARWESVAGKSIMELSTDAVPGSGLKRSLTLKRVRGGTDGYDDGGNLYRRLPNDRDSYGYDCLHLRFYMKFNEQHDPIHHYGAGFNGFLPTTGWPQGGAGTRPDGMKRWTTQVEPGDFSSWFFYTYWQGMDGSPPRGQTWGNSFEHGVSTRPVAKGEWICLELMVKMNDVGDTNGEQAYWIDGRLNRDSSGRVTSYLGKGFPASGSWTFGKFYPWSEQEGNIWDHRRQTRVAVPGGRPFPGFAWRNTPDLNINAVWLYRYMSQPEENVSQVWWSHLVVARSYIGPLTPLSKAIPSDGK